MRMYEWLDFAKQRKEIDYAGSESAIRLMVHVKNLNQIKASFIHQLRRKVRSA